MNTRETTLIRSRIDKVKGELQTELSKKKAERRNVGMLQSTLNRLKSWIR